MQPFWDIVRKFDQQTLLVIGDVMLDEFIWGTVSRISPEAPVPVVEVTSESRYPGGAANVARNLREFGATVSLVGITGNDTYSELLRSLLAEEGIGTKLLGEDSECRTVVKTRVISRQQQVVRVDRDHYCQPNPDRIQAALTAIDQAASDGLDAIIFADYAKGFLVQQLTDGVSEIARRHRIPVTVDPHPHSLVEWHGATLIKPNRSEALRFAGIPDRPANRKTLPSITEVGEKLLERWRSDSVLITMGDEGMLLFRPGVLPHQIPARAREVYDVSGAGDTALAVLTLGLGAGLEVAKAAELANTASGIVVGKLGTATITPEELIAAQSSVLPSY